MQYRQLLVVVSIVAICYGQTYSSCDPLKDTSCSPDKALGSSASIDFTEGESSDFKVVYKGDRISYGSNGADFVIQGQGDNPTIESNFYIMFGKVEAVVQAAPGTGIVSSFVLQSDDLDEIDWEWVGGDSYHVQTNYFSKGDTATYDRGGMTDMSAPQNAFHTYTVEWTDAQIVWYVDGVAIRTLPSTAPEGYPQTPMALRIGSWAGGDSSNPQGTIEWAGGITDYSQGPFHFFVKSIKVQDYSTGTEYKYGDQSGSWTSIQAIDGQINGDVNADGPVNSIPASSSTPASSTVPASSEPASSSTSSSIFSSTSSAEPSTTNSAEPSTTSSAESSTISIISSTPSSTAAESSSTIPASSTISSINLSSLDPISASSTTSTSESSSAPATTAVSTSSTPVLTSTRSSSPVPITTSVTTSDGVLSALSAIESTLATSAFVAVASDSAASSSGIPVASKATSASSITKFSVFVLAGSFLAIVMI